MKKLYYHISNYYDGKVWRCTHCNQETEDGMSEKPCSIPTATQSLLDDYRFEISVWNCKASLICFKEHDNTRQIFSLDTTPEIKEQIEALAEDSVYQAGGAINWSGIYPLSEELENFLEDKLKNGEIKLIEAKF